MFTFSAGVVEESNGQGSNSVGFIGNVNYFHRIKGWETSGSFSYAQNVQSVLVTYTTSYYNYSGRLHRRFGHGLAWIASFNGSHSGLTNQPGSNNDSKSYSTSFSIAAVHLDRQLYAGKWKLDSHQCRAGAASTDAWGAGERSHHLQRGQLWRRAFRDARAPAHAFGNLQPRSQQHAQQHDEFAQ